MTGARNGEWIKLMHLNGAKPVGACVASALDINFVDSEYVGMSVKTKSSISPCAYGWNFYSFQSSSFRPNL